MQGEQDCVAARSKFDVACLPILFGREDLDGGSLSALAIVG
jgi:hypothetical protein